MKRRGNGDAEEYAYLFILHWQDSFSYSVAVGLIILKKYLNSRLFHLVIAHHTDTAHTRSLQLLLETQCEALCSFTTVTSYLQSYQLCFALKLNPKFTQKVPLLVLGFRYNAALQPTTAMLTSIA